MDEPHEVMLSAGALRVRDTGARAGAPTLVFLHGLLVDGTLWDGVVERSRAWARCVVPDLPLGSHRLPLAPSAELAPPAVARLVAELLDALDLRDVTLVGNDTGGAIAQLVAAHHPQRLGRLALTPCDCFENFLPPMFRPLQWIARVPGGVAAAIQPARLRSLHATPLMYGMLVARPIPTERTAAWLAPALASADIRRDLAKFLRGISNRQTLEAAERLRGLDRPALVAWNERDRVFPRRYGERLADLLPHGRLETVPDSGAFVPLDQPERLAGLLEAFAREA